MRKAYDAPEIIVTKFEMTEEITADLTLPDVDAGVSKELSGTVWDDE